MGLRHITLILCLALCACDRDEVPSVAPSIASSTCPPPSHIEARGIDAGGEEVVARATVLDRALCLPDLDITFHGSTDLPVTRFVGALDITVGGESVWTPMSAFLDLGDPASISVASEAQTSVVTILGPGDSGYVAELTIRDNAVIRRRVFNEGFEGEAGEYTEYRFIDN